MKYGDADGCGCGGSVGGTFASRVTLAMPLLMLLRLHCPCRLRSLLPNTQTANGCGGQEEFGGLS